MGQPAAVSRRPVVGVIGASSAEDATLALAEEMGRAIAGQGWHLICGGGGGVMEHACRGFTAARGPDGGQTIGVLPSDDASWANPYVDIAIPTGMGWARNALLVRSTGAVVAIGGCAGTLSEIAYAWQMDRPIVGLVPSGGWAARLAGSAVDDRRQDVIEPAESVAEALEALRRHLER